MHFLLKLSADVDCRTVIFRFGILAEILAALGNSNLDPLSPSPRKTQSRHKQGFQQIFNFPTPDIS